MRAALAQRKFALGVDAPVGVLVTSSKTHGVSPCWTCPSVKHGVVRDKDSDYFRCALKVVIIGKDMGLPTAAPISFVAIRV